MNFNQLQIFEYSLHCFQDAVNRSEEHFQKVSPIYQSNGKFFTANSIAFDPYSIKIPFDEGLDSSSLRYHVLDTSDDSKEPFFHVRKFIYNELKGNGFLPWEKYINNPDFLLLALIDFATNADTSEISNLPKIFRNYKELNADIELPFFIPNSDDFSVVSLVKITSEEN